MNTAKGAVWVEADWILEEPEADLCVTVVGIAIETKVDDQVVVSWIVIRRSVRIDDIIFVRCHVLF